MDTLDNTKAHRAQLHTNDKHRAEAYADRMQSLGYRVTKSSDYSHANRGAIYTVTVAAAVGTTVTAANVRAAEDIPSVG